MEKNVLNKNKCYLPETIPLCEEMNKYTNDFFKDLNDFHTSNSSEFNLVNKVIIKDYARVKQQFETSRTKMKPVENYEAKLAAIKLEIAEICLSKGDKHSAKNELREALAIYQKLGTGPNSEKIEKLLLSL